MDLALDLAASPEAAEQFEPDVERAPARVPDGLVCYAVGDIHGRLDLFERMIDRIEADHEQHCRDSIIVLLGDYVDRGPSSRGVLQAIIDLQTRWQDRLIVLLGNHEEAMLHFLTDPAFGPRWLQHGGRDTLMSYQVAIPAGKLDDEAWDALRIAFSEAMPPAHHNLLENLQYFATIGDYVFVHAGVRPGVLLEDQSAEDMLWIRDAFLTADWAIDQTVVHGHTPSPEPVLAKGRIGIDTGAYATGVLTAVKLIEDRVDLFKVTRR